MVRFFASVFSQRDDQILARRAPRGQIHGQETKSTQDGEGAKNGSDIECGDLAKRGWPTRVA